MSTRELILLSPYRLPTQGTLYLGDEEVAAFLNGYAALWHPAALAGASGPPRVSSPYDHEQPSAGHIYAVPDQPPTMLPDDWEDRARATGAAVFTATADRTATMANLSEALGVLPPAPGAAAPRILLDQPTTVVAPFLGLGLGHLQLEALFEAMSHQNVLGGTELWQDVLAAVRSLAQGDADAVRNKLEAAAGRLLAAREVLYAVAIHLIDMFVPPPTDADAAWPSGPDHGQPLNVIAPAGWLEGLSRNDPTRLQWLRGHVAASLAEVCGGTYEEREDPLLPVESQLWNLLKGLARTRELVGKEVSVFGRRRFGFHPQLPLWLQSAGVGRALLVAFDESVLPAHRAAVIAWPAPGGKQVEAFTRAPHPADSPQTVFHLAYHLHQTIMQDQAATLAVVHRGGPASPWYTDWMELSRLAPVLGSWTTLSQYFNQVLPGDYTSAASADEFHGEYLVERAGSTGEGPAEPAPAPQAGAHPIAFFARHVRERRILDTCLTLAAMHRVLARADVASDLPKRLAELEDRLEQGDASVPGDLESLLEQVTALLAARLVARGPEDRAGYVVLNPCGFRRRVTLELPGAPPPVGGSVKAAQADGATARVVVEVPALGFAWLPRGVDGNTPAPGRMRLADDRCVRNEFFEAEVDLQTGGVRSVRDMRTRAGRMGQQLVFNPGSTMRARQVRTTSTGPALGEIVSEGVLLNGQDQELATYRQRLRAWLGRPVLELRIELVPALPPDGYPWHAYYAARFAWREERSALLRGVSGAATVTSHSRPETPDFLEVRIGRQNVVLFPAGLPFHQRHGGRMLDILLVCPGETAQAFELGIGLDREYPMQTALGLVTPAPVMPVDRGPPPVGHEGWLFHLDAPNVVFSSLRPAPLAESAGVAVLARLLECGGVEASAAQLRCPRDPSGAALVDATGMPLAQAVTRGDMVILDVGANDLAHVRIEFP
jgi:hypothetical protein